MKTFVNRLVAFVVILVATMGTDLFAEPMRLVYPEYPPYTATVDGKPAGIGVDLIKKIMAEAGVPIIMRALSANYARCVAMVKDGGADGFFLGSQNAERDAIAIKTDTILITKRVWIVTMGSDLNPNQPDFKSKAKVAVLKNSNPHAWLKDNGYSVAVTPGSDGALLKALDVGRSNAIFTSDLLFAESLKGAGKSANDYQMIVQSESPLALYVSKQYAAKNPDAVNTINAAIKKVASTQE